jgi:hypothetical protein
LAQRALVPRLVGRVIAVKHGVLLRPDADVMFVSDDRTGDRNRALIETFDGEDLVCRGRSCPDQPHAKHLARTATHDRLSDDPGVVAGLDGGTSAINLAYLRGASEIVLLGYDMRGGRWYDGPHHQSSPKPADFARHLATLPAIAQDAHAKGLRIVNCSPGSAATMFESQPLEVFL